MGMGMGMGMGTIGDIPANLYYLSAKVHACSEYARSSSKPVSITVVGALLFAS